jgi:uncharacterized membrane protein YfcA
MAGLHAIAYVLGTFLIAGTVKGIIGFGLPTLSLALLAVVFDLPTAMALMLVPSFVTNVWQAIAGGGSREVLARVWPFLAAATLAIFLGAEALARFDYRLLETLLGLLMLIYAISSLAGLRLGIPARRHGVAIAFGLVNGILTGMTGSFVMPGVIYLQSIGLRRDELIQAMGMLFTVSTVALALALAQQDLLPDRFIAWSMLAVIPALAGMAIGRRIRERLSEAHFRRVFLAALLVLGAYLTVGIVARG